MEQTTARRSEPEVRELIRTIIQELAPSPDVTDIEDAHLIDNLGYHSLGLLELAFTLEDEFGLPPISEEQGRAIQTVRNVEDYVVAQLSAGVGG